MPRIRNAKHTTKTESPSPSKSRTRRAEPLQSINIQGSSGEIPADETLMLGKRRVRAPRKRTKKPDFKATDTLPGSSLKAKETPSSPLPPSSPLFGSPSSHAANFLPVATSDDDVLKDHRDTKAFDAEENLEMQEEFDFDSDVYRWEEEGEGTKRALEFSPGGSDPFGFFALESKLKAERLQRPPAVRTKLNPVLTVERPLKVPRTPHKQRIGKRASGTLEGPSSDTREASLPSSPSPAKGRRSSARIAKVGLDLNSDREGEEKEEDKNEEKADERKEKEKSSRAKGKRREIRSSDSPERLANNLKALLPKRRANRNLKRSGKRAKKESDEEDDTEAEDTRKSRTRGRGKARRRVEEDIDVDADEQTVRERQARIEYFKKLEGYKMEKENVYVI